MGIFVAIMLMIFVTPTLVVMLGLVVWVNEQVRDMNMDLKDSNEFINDRA